MAITEDYVSFETAKLLKEKGFDVPCLAYWFIGSEAYEKFSDYPFNWNEVKSDLDWLSRPTQQMAMKWLREVHKIFITIEIKGDPRKEDFIYYKWSVAKYCSIMIDRIDNNLMRPEDYWIAPYEEEETYERTCEAAIKYCLENLI